MSNIFNDDFHDFLAALNSAKVRYILVGGSSVKAWLLKNNRRYGYMGRAYERKLSKN